MAGEDDLHRLELTVSIRHPEDDHLALDATVRLTGTSSTGVAVLPQTLGLTDEPGEYAGTVDLVGGTTWDLTVQSAQPEGRLDLRVDPDAGQVTTLGATASQVRALYATFASVARLPDAALHAPWAARPLDLAEAGIVLGRDYPEPIVQHEVARAKTLERYAVVRRAR